MAPEISQFLAPENFPVSGLWRSACDVIGVNSPKTEYQLRAAR